MTIYWTPHKKPSLFRKAWCKIKKNAVWSGALFLLVLFCAYVVSGERFLEWLI